MVPQQKYQNFGIWTIPLNIPGILKKKSQRAGAQSLIKMEMD